MTSVSAAMSELRRAFEGLVAEQAALRRELQSLAQQGFRRGAATLRAVRGNGVAQGGPRKRGRAFKFSDAQATELRKQVEGGKSAVALAKELKVSLPTLYSTLKRVGWTARRGRPAARAAARNGVPRKRGRAFKFAEGQAAEFRKQVEGGRSAVALAKELKVSLPTMYNTLKRAGWSGRGGRSRKFAPPVARKNGSPAKRGRPYKFTEDQAAGFRKRVESGETATALAKELKVSLPAIYNTLKRAGWTGRKGRKARAA